MKTAYLRWAGVWVLLALMGCVPSLHPIYTEAELVFDAELVGVWVDPEGKESWTFSRDGERAYGVVYVDEKGAAGRFKGHLAKVKGVMFLDLFPEEIKVEGNDFYKMHLLPVHTFLLVHQVAPLLRFSVANPDWLKTLLEADPAAIKHEVVDEKRIVLTAATEQLQEFWVKHAKTEKAFGDPVNYARKAP